MSIVATLEKDGKKLLSVLEIVVKDGERALFAVSKYLPSAAALASLIFPGFAPEIAAGETTFSTVAGLIESAVAEVEQKYAALPKGTASEAKAADVLQIVGQVVLDGLAKLKITADSAYVQSLINAVVALLNIPSIAA